LHSLSLDSGKYKKEKITRIEEKIEEEEGEEEDALIYQLH